MRSLLWRSDGFDHPIHRFGGETIRFSSLDFPTIPRDGLWAPPLFPPSQTFQFGSLEFITDQLSALHLHEEEAASVDTEEPSAPTKPRDLRRR